MSNSDEVDDEHPAIKPFAKRENETEEEWFERAKKGIEAKLREVYGDGIKLRGHWPKKKQRPSSKKNR